MKILIVVLALAAVTFAESERWIQPRFSSIRSTGTTGNVQYDDDEEKARMKTQTQLGSGDDAQKELVSLMQGIVQIKSDIIRKSGDLQSESQWVASVKQIILQFKSKVLNVRSAMDVKKTQLKTLLHKKRQLENLSLQIELNKKLDEAKTDMKDLKTALKGIDKKKTKFGANEAAVREQVEALTKQLTVLNGGELPEGVTSGTDSSSASSSGSA